MSSVFAKIIAGDLPSYKIFESDELISILTLDQIHLGHTLLITKKEINHWTDVPPELYQKVALVSLNIGQAIQKATQCPRVITTTIGFEVPHYHLHMIPAWSHGDLSFAKASRRSDAEMKTIQQKIISHLR